MEENVKPALSIRQMLAIFTRMSVISKTFNERTFHIVASAHISSESVREAEETIVSAKPDTVCVELDEKRAESLLNPSKYRELDIIKIIKRGEGFLMLVNVVLSSFQKRMGMNIGNRPGEEMLKAIETAKKLEVSTVNVDRSIQTTLKRAWRKTSLWGKAKLMALLLESAFSRENVSEEEIERLKSESALDEMMAGFAREMPSVKSVLIDERDEYLAKKIWKARGKNIVAVLGAGHVAGVVKHLESLSEGKEEDDVEELEEIPPKSIISRALTWIVPLSILALIAASFFVGGKTLFKKAALSWILYNSVPASIGVFLGAGHILTALTAFIASPITSLSPFIGVGMCTGVAQAFLSRPTVKDMENLSEEAMSVRGFYKNRILRTLLVILFSSIGGSIGTFMAGGAIIKGLTSSV